MRWGRDSIRVRLIPRAENSVRQSTSQAGCKSPLPQNTSAVLCGAPSSVYHHAMSYRLLLEGIPPPSGGTEQDVEPYFEEPLVELDLDTLE